MPYLVKVTTKGEGVGSKIPEILTTWFMDDPKSSSFSEFQPGYLIHMESIHTDTLCYLESCPQVSEKDLRHLKHVNISPKGHSSQVHIQKSYFAQLDQTLLKRLQNKYWPDFVLHGYTLEPFIQMVK